MKIKSRVFQVASLILLFTAIGIGLGVTRQPLKFQGQIAFVKEKSMEEPYDRALKGISDQVESVDRKVSSDIQDQLLFGFSGIVAQILSGMFRRS